MIIGLQGLEASVFAATREVAYLNFRFAINR
jgi:hypothetical protein